MAFTKTTAGNSVLFQETVTVADSGGSNATYIPTSIIDNTMLDWEDKKLAVTVRITSVSGADGDADVYVQTSPTGDTTGDVITPGSGVHPRWVNSATLNYTIDTTALASASLEADLTDVYGPYMRFWVFTDAGDTDGAFDIEVSVSAPSTNMPLKSTDIGGIGADPS